MLSDLRARIEDRTAVIGVVGLGYVGLPLASLFAQAGFNVVGVDLKPDRTAIINGGRNPIEGDEPGLSALVAETVRAGRLCATVDYAELGRADIVLVAVETPVDADHRPRYSALTAALCSLREAMKSGALVVVESTIAPRTTTTIVIPLLSGTGKRPNTDFFVGVCPERVMPGKLLTNLQTMSRVCGGSSVETAETMVALYRTIVRADLDATDCLTAELVKTAENAYRDVNIAFANELALVCEATGSDFLRVRALVNKSPGRAVLAAGAGVGGHCIPKDSWLLAHGVDGLAPIRLLSAAREVNEYMPRHVANLVEQALQQTGREIAGATVAVLGYSYLENSDDTRNSPSAVLVAVLKERRAIVVIHDPWVREYQGDLLVRLKGCDAVVVMVAHKEYVSLDIREVKAALRTPVLIDGRRVFDSRSAIAAGFAFRAVGLGPEPVPGN